MRILINLAPLKSGGGQNVALNLLLGLEQEDLGDKQLLFMVARDSVVHRYLSEQQRHQFIVAPRNPLLRICYERFPASRFVRKQRIEAVYSYFGFGLFAPGIKQVCGSADSNLFYPEIDFWRDYRGLVRLKKYLVDQYRIFGIKRCDGVIFENEALLGRARRLYRISNGIVVKPSIAAYPGNSEFVLPSHVPKGVRKGLFLCGWHLNKNIMMIPEIACELKKRGQTWHFLLTAMPDGNPLHRQFVQKVNQFGVSDSVSVVGLVSKGQLASLYAQIDFVFLLSKLESFSNNIIEAWCFGRPLVVASEEWAVTICGDGALYVNRDSPTEIARVLVDCASDPERIRSLINTGRKRLSEYPTIGQRIQQELGYVESVSRSL